MIEMNNTDKFFDLSKHTQAHEQEHADEQAKWGSLRFMLGLTNRRGLTTDNP